jgi:tetrahydromethanopterin S-methyltransferase subunit B
MDEQFQSIIDTLDRINEKMDNFNSMLDDMIVKIEEINAELNR